MKYTPTEASIALGRTIRARREALGLTQPALAAHVSAYLVKPMKAITVLRIEKGTRATTIDEYHALAETLGLPEPIFEPRASESPASLTTVGDLSAAMIGTTIVRVAHEGGIVEGPLLDIEIDAEVHNIPRGDQEYRAKVTLLRVSLRIGSFTIDGLPAAHPVEIVR